MEAKFKVGDVVVYVNGDKFELGVVKTVIPVTVEKRRHLKQDGLHGEPTGELYNETSYEYFVNYHMGDTAARTCEENLHPIINIHAFTVLRRGVEDSIDLDPCRQLANKILDDIDDLVQCNFSDSLFNNHTGEFDESGEEIIEEGLVGGLYYELEDLVTSILKGEK